MKELVLHICKPCDKSLLCPMKFSSRRDVIYRSSYDTSSLASCDWRPALCPLESAKHKTKHNLWFIKHYTLLMLQTRRPKQFYTGLKKITVTCNKYNGVERIILRLRDAPKASKTSDGVIVGVCKSAYDLVKIENRSHTCRRSHHLDEIGVSISSVAYDPAKTRLSESQAVADGPESSVVIGLFFRFFFRLRQSSFH